MPTKYIDDLDKFLLKRIEELSVQIKGKGNPNAKIPPMPNLLMTALKNEWETTFLTSQWVIDEKDFDFRICLARLAGDEAKHFSLIENRLTALGGKKNIEELNKRTPLYHYLMQQTTTFDRAVTGPYTREALAVMRNQVFLEHCHQIKDSATIDLYETIQKDETHHHQLGRAILKELIKTDQEFNSAKIKITEVLNVVDEIQEMAVMKMGVCRLPGC